MRKSTLKFLDFQKNPYRSRVFLVSLNCVFFDRIDIHCEVPLVNFRELSSNTNTGESSETIRTRVIAARGIQLERFKKSSNSTNSAMGSRQVRQHCQLNAESTGYLEHAMEEMNFSARAHDRILKVASLGSVPTNKH